MSRIRERYYGPGSGEALYHPVRSAEVGIIGWELRAVGAQISGEGATQDDALMAFEAALLSTTEIAQKETM